jgi:CHASE3 domain sensor protein
MEFRQTLVTDLPCHKMFGDDSYRLAACFQSGVRDYPHETHIPASVHQANASSHQFRSHLLSGNAVFRTATFTGAAENADSFHAGILNLDSSALILPPFSSTVYQCAKPHEPPLLLSSVSFTRKDGAIKMMRKIALRLLAVTLIAFMALNAFLAINRLRLIQKSAALTLQSSTIQANISAVLQALTDMETGQRGYLLTGDSDYLLPYNDGKNRIGTDFASLRAGLANRTEQERSIESELESLAASKQAEMERTISLRQQGYRRRAFNLVDTNEGRDYMDGARKLSSSLSSAESSSFARFDKERTSSQSKALSETVIANSCLLLLAVGLFGLARYHERVLEQETVQSTLALTLRDSQLGKLTSVLSNQARSKMTDIEADARLLLEEYGGFLPRHGHECAEHLKETAAQMERLRQELLGHPGFNQADQKAA